MSDNNVSKDDYLNRLEAFHKRPHGKAIDDLVVEYVLQQKLESDSNHLTDTHGSSPGSSPQPSVMLEIGCGAGHLARRLAARFSHLHVVAIDPNYWYDAQARNPHARIAYRPELKSSARKYDTVVCCNVLGHLEHPLSALQDMRDALAIGGYLIISVPSRLYEQAMSVKNWLTGYRSDPTLLHRWYDWQLAGLVELLGLQLIAKHDVSTKLGFLCESTVLVFKK